MTMSQKDSPPPHQKNLPARLLRWYDIHKRDLPWRAKSGAARTDPYYVWLSEIIMQQTQIAAGTPYYERFVRRWPTVHDLAAADLDDVLHAWQGLGYYARARNLHKCAQQVAHDLGGIFPDTEDGLLALPGVGPYTAAAIAAIAFDRQTTAVDGNVERVMARLYAVETPLPKAKKEIHQHARQLTPAERCGDYAQAVMELGATLCRPRNPACDRCPWDDACAAHAHDHATHFPKRAAKIAKPTRYGVVFWLVRDDGAVLVQRRAERGLLGGMMEFPSTQWRQSHWENREVADSAPILTGWQSVDGVVRHTFSHFHLELRVVRGKLERRSNAEMLDGSRWRKPSDFGTLALPSVMKKVAVLLG